MLEQMRHFQEKSYFSDSIFFSYVNEKLGSSASTFKICRAVQFFSILSCIFKKSAQEANAIWSIERVRFHGYRPRQILDRCTVYSAQCTLPVRKEKNFRKYFGSSKNNLISRLVILQPSPLAAGAVPDHLELFILIISGTEWAIFSGILKQSMGARNRVEILLSYRPARLHILAELFPWNRFLGSLKV